MHRANREIIWHLTCGGCGNWWSYATMEPAYSPRRMLCPHCGRYDTVVDTGGDMCLITGQDRGDGDAGEADEGA